MLVRSKLPMSCFVTNQLEKEYLLHDLMVRNAVECDKSFMYGCFAENGLDYSVYIQVFPE